MNNTIACIFSYEITKGMKSFGPKGLLKHKKSTELINSQIKKTKKITKNICVVTGFGADKLESTVSRINKKYTSFLFNGEFSLYNEAYALKLILNNYKDVDCIIILSDGLLMDFTGIKIPQTSTLFVTKPIKNNKTDLGCVYNTEFLEHMFYDINMYIWTGLLVLYTNEIRAMLSYMSSINTENMFLFEIINGSIDHGAKYHKYLVPNKNFDIIKTMNDTKKIKVLQ